MINDIAPKKIYLTIDDSPSVHTRTIVDFLKSRTIPAVFFCRGEYIERHKEAVIYAIRQGFLVGNHSYSHPYFSHLAFAECCREIQATEVLINDCYAQAGIARPHKVIRLPFADRGTPETAKLIQDFLRVEGFVALDFGAAVKEQGIDALWTWDPQDYKRAMIENHEVYRHGLEKVFKERDLAEEVILLHDFDHNHPLFAIAMTYLLSQNVEFMRIWIKENN